MNIFIPKQSLHLIIAFCFLLYGGCQSPTDNSGNPITDQNNTSGTGNLTNSTSSDIQLIPCPPSPPEAAYPNAWIAGYRFKNHNMMFDIRDFTLGVKTPQAEQRASAVTKKGQYLHFNIDNKEHKLTNHRNFLHPLTDGNYDLFAFLVRSYHENVRSPKALWAKRVEVDHGAIVKSEEITEPMVVYGTPWKLYMDEDAQQVVLDFQLLNTTISPNGNKVKVTINEAAIFILDKWQAHYIKGLTWGQHTAKLELLDADGKIIHGPISNTFVLAESKPDS